MLLESTRHLKTESGEPELYESVKQKRGSAPKQSRPNSSSLQNISKVKKLAWVGDDIAAAVTELVGAEQSSNKQAIAQKTKLAIISTNCDFHFFKSSRS